jgi:hypothetical protein
MLAGNWNGDTEMLLGIGIGVALTLIVEVGIYFAIFLPMMGKPATHD